jgi:hypothetical protein
MFIWQPYVRISKVALCSSGPVARRAASRAALANDLPGMVTLPSG